uniref:Uncharacterized protein n=1 Tax=Lotharella globosa TaxID=91324 RepID=A0A6V3JFU8_9EUKA
MILSPGEGPRLVFFSAETTRRTMNRSLREFCTQKLNHDEKEGRFDPAGNAAAAELASPELVVVVGRHFSMKGMPSWMCGTAEIGRMRDLSYVDVDLREILSQYDRSTQRHGV